MMGSGRTKIDAISICFGRVDSDLDWVRLVTAACVTLRIFGVDPRGFGNGKMLVGGGFSFVEVALSGISEATVAVGVGSEFRNKIVALYTCDVTRAGLDLRIVGIGGEKIVQRFWFCQKKKKKN